MLKRAILLFTLFVGAPAWAETDIPPRDQFLGNYAPLVLADQPLLLGLVRRVSPPDRALPVSLVALDTATLKERWRTAGFGDASIDGVHIHTHLGRIEEMVIAAQANRVVRGIRLKDGGVAWSVPLSDLPKTLCITLHRAWIKAVDGTVSKIDPRSGKATKEKKLPPACAYMTHRLPAPVKKDGSPDDPPTRLTAKLRSVPKGLQAKETVVDTSGMGLLLLRKRPGTAVPHLGLDNRGTIAWHRPLDEVDPFAPKARIPEVATLARDLAFVAYRLRSGEARLQALSRQTGKKKWDVAVPHPDHEVDWIVVRDDRVFVGHWTYLEALDLDTGKAVAAFGIW